MKTSHTNRCYRWQTAVLLTGCALAAGCVDSSSGKLYSELPAPQSPAFAEWKPLAESEVPETPPAEDKSASPQEPDGTPADSNSADVEVTNTVQQATARQTEASSEVTPAVAVEETSETKKSPTEQAELLASMTAEERMNYLMNNPDLEESTEVLEIKLLIPEKRLRKEEGGKITRVSYDDIDLLKILNMQPVPADAVDYFPDWLNDLDGQRIRIRGFMFPPYQATDLKRFALARDNGICCFVRTPKIYDIIDVRMADGQTTDYIANTPFDVEGTFRIQPVAEDGELFKLYRIDDAKVIE